MLPEPNRLKDRRDFSRVYSRGIQYRSPFASLYAAPRREGPTRVGISASKKVGGAVQRNRAKRRLRAASRAAVLRTGDPIDAVLVARSATVDADFVELSRVVEDLFRQAASGVQRRSLRQDRGR